MVLSVAVSAHQVAESDELKREEVPPLLRRLQAYDGLCRSGPVACLPQQDLRNITERGRQAGGAGSVPTQTGGRREWPAGACIGC